MRLTLTAAIEICRLLAIMRAADQLRLAQREVVIRQRVAELPSN